MEIRSVIEGEHQREAKKNDKILMQIRMSGGQKERHPQRDREELIKYKEADQEDYSQKSLGI